MYKLNQKKKIGVIGAGNWGINHVKTLYRLGCLKGVVDINKNVLTQVNQKFSDVKTYNNIEDALNDDYDGFIISTPASSHYDMAVKVIKHGFPVLIEKPLALNLSDSEKLINLADIYKSNVMVGHVLLFHPAIRKIKEIIDSGKIGSLQYIYSNRLNLGQVRTEENVFWSLAPHDISVFDFILQCNPIKIKTFGGEFIQEDIQDITLSMFEYPNNVKAHIFVSWLHPFKEHRIIIIGSNGMVRFEDSSQDNKIELYNKNFNMVNGKIIKHDGLSEVIDFEKTLPLDNELIYFINNLNSSFKISNIYSGYNVVKILSEISNKINNKANV